MIAFLAIVAAISAVSASKISPCPLNYAAAVAYCASQGSTLASVTGANLAALSAQAGNTPKWVGSWNGDHYNGACLVLSQGTVVVADCGAQNQALCNDPSPCPPIPTPAPNPCPGPGPCHSSSSSSHKLPICESSSSSSSCQLPDPLPLPCSSSSSSSSLIDCLSSSSSYGPVSRSSRSSRRSSSSCYESSSCNVDPAFQYVYLTNTISTTFTSTSIAYATTTETSTEFFATVQAYTVISAFNG